MNLFCQHTKYRPTTVFSAFSHKRLFTRYQQPGSLLELQNPLSAINTTLWVYDTVTSEKLYSRELKAVWVSDFPR